MIYKYLNDIPKYNPERCVGSPPDVTTAICLNISGCHPQLSAKLYPNSIVSNSKRLGIRSLVFRVNRLFLESERAICSFKRTNHSCRSYGKE